MKTKSFTEELMKCEHPSTLVMVNGEQVIAVTIDEDEYTVHLDAPDYLAGQDNTIPPFKLSDIKIDSNGTAYFHDGVDYCFSFFERMQISIK